jgi:hypothetical protein
VKENITNDDLAVVRVENYNTSGISKDSLDTPETREILGIISPVPSKPGSAVGQAQIFLDGAVWNATPGRDGRYDLQCVGAEKHSARWYIPKTKRKQADNPSPSSGDRRLYFAAILPHTTKHPTLASLNKTHMDIYDWYTLNTDLVTQDMLTPLETPTPATRELQSEYWSTPHTETSSTAVFNVPIDDLHRKLIVASSFWVMLCEGWSSHYTFPTVTTSCLPSNNTPIDRSMSLPVTKDDKSAVASLTIPSSSMSTRQNTPERHSMSAASPTPSIAADTTTPASKRLSLSSFTFRRVSTTTASLKTMDVETSSFQSSAAASTHTDKSVPVIEKLEETPVQDVDSAPPRDPTAQFRHVANLQNPKISTPSLPSASRFGSMVRRMSNNTPTQDERTHRSRSISWRWSRPVQSKAAVDAISQRQETIPTIVMAHDNSPLAITPSPEETSIDSVAYEDSTTLEESTLASTVDTSAHQETDLELSVEKAAIQSDLISALPIEEVKLVEPAAIVDHEQERDVLASTVEVPKLPTESPSASGMANTRWSVSSSGSERMDVGSPYWRDFDRLQMNNFWQRTQYTPSKTISRERDDLPSEFDVVHDKNPTSVHGDEEIANAIPSIEQPEELSTPQKGGSFMENIRFSIGRRRRSSFAA